MYETNELFYDPEMLATGIKSSVAVGLDNSVSMTNHLSIVKKAGEDLLHLISNSMTLDGEVQTTIASFSDDVKILKYPNESNEVSDRLRNLMVEGGTSLHLAYCKLANALLRSIKEQQKMGCVFHGAVLMLFTDGEPTDTASDAFYKTKDYLRRKGIKTIAFATDGADMNFLRNNFDNVFPIENINNFPDILKGVCNAILPAISQSRPGEHITKKFKTNEGIEHFTMQANELELDDSDDIIDVTG